MTIQDIDAVEEAQRIADDLLRGTSSDSAVSHSESGRADIDPEAAADRVAEHWVHAAESLIFACAYIAEALNAFESDSEKLETFLSRLVAKRVLSENDVLARLKGQRQTVDAAEDRSSRRHALAAVDLVSSCPHTIRIIYQICLLIEEVGIDRAEARVVNAPGRDARRRG